MNWTQVVLPLILGLVMTSWQNVQALESFTSKGNNSTVVKPGNKTHSDAPMLVDNFLYMQFACRGKPNGLRLPVAGSCADYYECQQGVAQRLTCKVGMHFSIAGLTCLDARLSKCQPEQMEPAFSCEGPCCGRDDGIYPAMGSCSNFLVCVNGKKFQGSCGKFLEFSPESLVCDIPDRARCSAVLDKDIIDEGFSNHEVPDGTFKPTMYMISHRVCRSYPDGFNVPIFGSCNKFYLCIQGLGYLKSCGSLQFNPQKRYCDSKIRMYCPAIEDDDVILPEDEYIPVDTKPMPLPRPKPIPLDFEDEDVFHQRPVYWQIENEDELKPPHMRPHHGKKPTLEGGVQQKPHGGKRPRPPLVDEEEEEDMQVQGWPQWGKKPAPKPQLEKEEEVRVPQWGKKPIKRPQVEEEQAHGKKPAPKPEIEKEEKVKESQWGKKPVPIPPLPEDYEPHRRPGGNAKPNERPSVSVHMPVPPNIVLPKDDQKENNNVAVPSSNICADEPVGALIAMPGDCTKYVRCRWDWFERRAIEVISCPQDMHFNSKSKYCDWPENAGCIANTQKTQQINKKTNKFAKIF